MNARCRTIKEEFRKNSAICESIVTLLHLISNKARFRIVCLLGRGGEFCVHDIKDVVNEGKLSHISQQLTILRLAGIVQKRRSNKLILYAIKDERVRRLIEFLCLQYLKNNITHEKTTYSRRRNRGHDDGKPSS
jgi:DNA-binding transcriptional ArsR family regulator